MKLTINEVFPTSYRASYWETVPNGFYKALANEPGTMSEWQVEAEAIFAEAWLENRDRTKRKAQARALATMHAREARTLAQIESLRSEQIKGSDNRLAEFWQEAKDIATREGFCTEYDRLAEELGGPRRSYDYAVDVEVTLTTRITVSVSARDTDEAISEVEGWDESEILDYAYSSLTDYYSVEGWVVQDVNPAD